MIDPLPLKSLNHVAMVSTRLEESRAFYRDVLGFRELDRPAFKFAGAWLVNYGLMIHLIQADGSRDIDGPISTRAEHLALHTDDLDGAEAALRRHGIPYRTSQVADRAIRQLFFHDPDGHHIEVGTYPPFPGGE